MKKYPAFLFALLVTICGCQNSGQRKNLLLNENELCFNNEKLASISKSGDIYYIGAESSGRIYEYSTEKNAVIDTLNIDCGRIYHVKPSLDMVNTFWIGTQNMGLRKVYKEGDSLKLSTAYTISGKDTRYSSYECYIDTTTNTVYSMTSHGIFKVVENSTQLQPVYPEYEEGETPEPMVAANMIKSDDFLYVATAEGLAQIKTGCDKKESVIILLKNKYINNITLHDGAIYALTNNTLYRCNLSGALIDSIAINPSKIYYYSNGIHYFLSENYLTLSRENTLHDLKQHMYVPLRRKLSIQGRNIVADSKDFSLMIAGNTILQVGHHLPSVFGEVKEGGAKLVCTDGKSLYYLLDKKIYNLEVGDSIAREVLELNEKGDIRFIECSSDGHSLYYINNLDEVYCCDLNSPKWKFWSPTKKYIGKPKKEITAVCSSSSVPGLILGIRDGLVNITEDNKINTITLLYNEKDSCIIPYISRFAVRDIDSCYMVPTMNDGLFYGKGMQLQLLNKTSNLQFIRDVAFSSNDTMPYILTNKHICNVCKDSILQNKNYSSRLLALNPRTFYLPGEVSGVRCILFDENGILVSDSTLFPDISFKSESSMVLNGSVYLGGPSGVIAIDEETKTWNYIIFKDSKVPNLLLIMGIIFAVVLMVVFYDRYKLGKRAMQTYKNGLILRVDELKTVDDFLETDTRLQLENLMTEIEAVDISGRKEALERIREISKRIMEQTESIPSLLTQKLIEQTRQIEETCFANAPSYIENSNEAIKAHTLFRLGGQLRTNAQWLESKAPLLKKYADYKTVFNEIASIPQITDKIIELLNSDDAHDDILKQIDKHLNDLDTDEKSKMLLDEYITGQIKKAEDVQSHYEDDSDHYLIIKEIIDKYKSFIVAGSEPVSKIVMAFPIYDKRLRLLEILQIILDNISVFRSKFACYQEIDDKLNSTSAYALLHEDEKDRIRKQDEDSRKKSKVEYKKISDEIKENITDFFNELKITKDQQLIDGLGLGQKKGKGQFMWENVLALLLSGTNYDYSTYSIILGNEESRIRDAKSDIRNAVTNCHSSIAIYAEENLSSIALLLLHIDNSRKN